MNQAEALKALQNLINTLVGEVALLKTQVEYLASWTGCGRLPNKPENLNDDDEKRG